MTAKAALSHGVPGVPKEPGSYGVSVPTALIPSPRAYCHSHFLISQKQSSVTQNCLPSVSATTRKKKKRKEGRRRVGGDGGQTHKPGSRHKIILHNTREFKEALPIPAPQHHLSTSPSTSLRSYEKKGRGGWWGRGG